MTENTAQVLVLALAVVWNMFLWGAFLFMVAYMDASYWILIIPACFTFIPKSKKDDE